jgi:hypothetical protein
MLSIRRLVSLAMGLSALAGCGPSDGSFAVVPEVTATASAPGVLFVASQACEEECRFALDRRLGAGSLERVHTGEPIAPGAEGTALVAVSEEEAYFVAPTESRIGRWTPEGTTFLPMPSEYTYLHANGEHVWAHGSVVGSSILFRIDGDAAVEIRREPTGEGTVGIVHVLPSGGVVWRTGIDTALELDASGAVVGPAELGVETTALGDGSVAVRYGTLSWETPSGTVTEPYEGLFIGLVGTSADADWVVVRDVVTDTTSHGRPITTPAICTMHFDGASSVETWCTEPLRSLGPLELVDHALVYGVWAPDGLHLFERPLR